MSSTGRTGEEMAEYYFKEIGWVMIRHQPRTIIARKNGKPCTIQLHSDGVPDYTGYSIANVNGTNLPLYRAAEVKESHGDSMPASRVRGEQRSWLARLPSRCGYIAVCWMDGQPKIELFAPIENSSYKRGQGLL